MAVRGWTNDLGRFSGTGFRHFEGMTPDEATDILRRVPEQAYDQQNDAPSFKDFLLLAQWYPGMTFHGYIVGADRTDERVTIEGFNHPNAKDICWDHHLQPDEYDDTQTWWD